MTVEELKGLTDEEMWAIACEFQKDILETGEIGKLCKAIRKAQLKKVVKWGNEPCEHLGVHEGLEDSPRHVCIKCWQSLLEE